MEFSFQVDLYPWRKQFGKLLDSGVLHPPGASAGVGEGIPTHPMAQLAYGAKKPQVLVTSAATGKLKPMPSRWRPPT